MKGDGVVQWGNWRYDKDKLPGKSSFLYYLDKPFNTEEDFSEEIWIAQEDLWIQNEIYSLIRKANDSISVFEGTGGDGDKDYTFTNPNWQITLRWKGGKEGNKLAATFRNLLPRQQRLDFKIRVLTDQTKGPTVIDLAKYQKKSLPALWHGKKPRQKRGQGTGQGQQQGTRQGQGPGREQRSKLRTRSRTKKRTEFRAKRRKRARKRGRTRRLRIVLPPTVSVKGVYRLEQVLNWETAAVRRIDGIYISQLGQRQSRKQPRISHKLLAYGERRMPRATRAASGSGRLGFRAGQAPRESPSPVAPRRLRPMEVSPANVIPWQAGEYQSCGVCPSRSY